MSTLSIDLVRERLSEIRALNSAQDIVAAGLVRGIELGAGSLTIRLAPGGLAGNALDVVIADIRRSLGAFDGVGEVKVVIEQTPGQQRGAPRQSPYGELGPIPGVRDIIAVSSAKGGVGKSTLASNLALAMVRLGKRVGLMDSDVFGPSLPLMFGITGRPEIGDDKRIFPIHKFGVAVMSIGFFLDDTSPVIWRGPMVMGLVRQFLKDVNWGELDVLLVDMPPGTGDAALTLVQQVPLAGAVIVTTPQEIATLDTERGIAMFRQVNTPVLGIIENMSGYACPHCGNVDDVFGSGGAQSVGEHFDVPLLGRLPLLPLIRNGGDTGKPLVADQPEHPVSKQLVDIATRLLEAVDAGRTATAAPTILD